MIKHLLITILLFCAPSFAQTDLEETFTKSFVLETKKIEIPGYPAAFNPSLTRWQGSLLMSFRVIPDPSSPFTSYIGLIWLDKNFTPIGLPHFLRLREQSPFKTPRAEDARLISVNKKLYIVYSDNQDDIITKGGFRVYIAELEWDKVSFSIKNVERINHFENENKNLREKNWVPFNYHGNLLLAYSLVPHKIFIPHFGTGTCATVATTLASTSWDWGELRGGTAALLEGDEYLAFFHSSKKMETVHAPGKHIPHYFMGAYTFAAHPPFPLTRISQSPIVGKGFYKGPYYKPYWGPARVIFPCGFISSEKSIWIAYGREDHEIWIAKFDKKGLFKSLIPVSSTV